MEGSDSSHSCHSYENDDNDGHCHFDSISGEPVTVDTRGRVRTSREQRRLILAEFERSGVSAVEFSLPSGLKYSTLAGWRHRHGRSHRPGRLRPVRLLPAHLATERVVLEPEEVQQQPAGWRKLGEEVTEELDWKPAQFIKRLYIRPKYANAERIVITPLPARLIDIDYALGRWEALTRYVDDGRREIDNNHCENAIRPTAVGKKNFLFVGHPKPGNAAR